MLMPNEGMIHNFANFLSTIYPYILYNHIHLRWSVQGDILRLSRICNNNVYDFYGIISIDQIDVYTIVNFGQKRILLLIDNQE